MKKIVKNIVIYFCTIMQPKLVVALANKSLEAIEMTNCAYKKSSEALELSNELYARTKMLNEQKI